MWRFLELCAAGTGIPPAASRQAPGSPGLDSAVDGNWTQECADQDLDRDCRQDKKQSPLQKLSVEEDSEILMIPNEYDMYGMEYLIGQY